jgi:hypothetical protein
MTPLLVAQLLIQFGLPLTQQIMTWVQSGKTAVTPEDFQALVTLSQYRSADALAAAGIKIVDGKVVPV